MRPSEIRALQREKHDYEHRGTALLADAYLPPPKPEDAIKMMLLMKEGIRNEAAIVGNNNFNLNRKKTVKADLIRDLFYAECEAFNQNLISYEALKKMYGKFLKALMKLNQFYYVD